MFFMPKQTKYSFFLFSWLNKLNKKTDFKGQHSFTLSCLYVADSATFLASNSVPNLIFLREQLVYSDMEK